MHYAEVKIPMELSVEINIKFRSPQVGAEVTRAEHRLPSEMFERHVSWDQNLCNLSAYLAFYDLQRLKLK